MLYLGPCTCISSHKNTKHARMRTLWAHTHTRAKVASRQLSRECECVCVCVYVGVPK